MNTMTTIIEAPKFASKDEEIDYWKNLAQEYQHKCDRIQRESDEFMMDSKQLEKEYETIIEQNEKKIREMSKTTTRAQDEIDALRMKLDICYKETANQQKEIDTLKMENQQQHTKIRNLEIQNDELERSRRIVEETMASFEQALNKELEKNALLENEVDEKECLKEKLQRLADETRDLKQELLVKEKERVPDNERFMNGFKNPGIEARLQETETQTSPARQEFQPALSPASRVMALNIVSDLIRKLGLSRFLCSQCGQVKCTEHSTDGGLLVKRS